IRGGAGNGTIGGAVGDTIDLSGSSGHAVIFGKANESITLGGATGSVAVPTPNGNYTVAAGSAVFAGAGSTITSGSGSALIDVSAGNDTIREVGVKGSDTVTGFTEGQSFIFLGSAQDSITAVMNT